MRIVSTYRLQFHKGFTFRDATAIVPYLHDLGITHVYASPYLKAVAGSLHGYDVIDQSRLNPQIGTPEDYREFVDALSHHGMSHILDTVPNHMGVETNDNNWWNDVLTHGSASKYANFFDIDWEGFSPRRELTGKVLMPVLGETLAQALESQSLRVQHDEAGDFISYHDRRFPLSPDSDTSQPPAVLLDRQHYRIIHWRAGADEINYRRFFDISGLAALQMQRQEVFDEVHKFTFQLLAERSVAGLRVDHPDGLLDPREYFDRLQAKYAQVCPGSGKLYVAVEKILNGDERLREDWAVSGTSGYDFLCAINDLFVAQANEAVMTDIYNRFTGEPIAYADWVYRAKSAVLDTSMYSEMVSLTNRLDALAQSERRSSDFTKKQLHDALREVIASFPVYRSYVSARGVTPEDIAVVDAAVDQARGRNPQVDADTFNFIRDSVLLRYPVADSVRARQLDFAQRFQQLTSPVNAKGVEDCTFYNFNRLVSLNEVGGDPGRFGRSCEEVHAYLADRQAKWPGAMSSLSTHDTKRSEDVRARLNVLSEIPGQWSDRLSRWRELNAGACDGIHPNDQILLYQTLLGAWPIDPMDDAARRDFVSRITAYMVKATREAKQRTSWSHPDKAYENAVTCLIESLIDPQIGAQFLADFLPFQQNISRLGMLNSLAQTVIRLTAPGVSDTYQGTELWDLSLVDPDNRRPVDYQTRKAMLSTLSDVKDLSAMHNGRIKLFVTRVLLHHRRAFPDLYLDGLYEPIKTEGRCSENLFAFARLFEDQSLIVVVPRLVASLPEDNDWAETRIAVPSPCRSWQFVNLFTGAPMPVKASGDLHAAELFRNFPIAVLTSLKI